MKPEITVTRAQGINNRGRVEVVEPDGSNSTFHLWDVRAITIKCDRQPEVRVYPQIVNGQVLALLTKSELRVITNSSTNMYIVPDGHVAVVKWIERERTPSI